MGKFEALIKMMVQFHIAASQDFCHLIGNSLVAQWLELSTWDCCGPRFSPWSGKKDAASCVAWPHPPLLQKKKKKTSVALPTNYLKYILCGVLWPSYVTHSSQNSRRCVR